MMYTKKRIMIIAVVAVIVMGLLVTTAVLLFRDDTKYTDFRTMQLEAADLAQFGVSTTDGDGLYSRALWVGEGYACTMEQDGQMGERISVPYVEWQLTPVSGREAYWTIEFAIAEQAKLNDEAENSTSPWKYSNIEITLVAGAQTNLSGICPVGWISKGSRAIENHEEVLLELSILGNRCYSEKELERDLRQQQQERVFQINSSGYSVPSVMYAVRMRLSENRSWNSPGRYLSGSDPERLGRFALRCKPAFYNRYGENQTEFSQTAYFKVTYDIENTVTGERATHSTGWIEREYVSKLR